MLRITVITLFPQMFQQVFEYSIIHRAQEENRVQINFLDLRTFGIGRHKIVDDKPYGGGIGMVLKINVLEPAIAQAKKDSPKDTKVILLDPKGAKYTQSTAKRFSRFSSLILISGRYEGFDARVYSYIDEAISIGDFVLSGGEIAAMAIIESTIRLIPGVLKKEEATEIESFSTLNNQTVLEYPQYTRPEVYKGEPVPHVLLSGNQKQINEFRRDQAIELTKANRPDIFESKK